jgi:DNA-binding SARP family transcriptional activator
VEYKILGPVGVRDDGQPVDLGTPKQRALLALLLLHAGQVVPTDRLVDLLWDGAPPARAEVSLRSYAANLRRVLPPDTLVHGAGGYRLAVDPADLDAHRFEAGVAAAEAAAAGGDLDRAHEVLTAALAEWEGPALADVASQPFARLEAARLEERRLVALERRFELELATGQGGDGLVAELERAVTTHPLREGLRALLMRALDAGGRTAEALAAYADLRERLADEVGLDPSPALQALEADLRAGRPPATHRRSGRGPNCCAR